MFKQKLALLQEVCDSAIYAIVMYKDIRSISESRIDEKYEEKNERKILKIYLA